MAHFDETAPDELQQPIRAWTCKEDKLMLRLLDKGY